MISATANMQNNKGGNGRYAPLRRKVKEQEEEINADIELLNMLNDPRMRFKNSRDPIYVAFDHLQRQSLKRLATDFVKDLVNDSVAFISKAISQ